MIKKPEDAAVQSLGELGALVRAARLRAGLSRSRVARLAGVSESTLKNVEAGRHHFTAATLRGLLGVAALDLPQEIFGALLPDVRGPDDGLNACLAPGFQPLELYRQMTQVLAGAGGHLEQTFAYLDTASAADWCALAAQEDYAKVLDSPAGALGDHAGQQHQGQSDHDGPEGRGPYALARVARAVAAQVGAASLDVLLLGPGDGRLEAQLMVALARRLVSARGRCFLLDISQPLLSAAYQALALALAPFPALIPIAIQGDFHRLPQYTRILAVPPGPAPRRQLVCLLGGTFGNLDHEVRFLRDSLCAFAAGSLLLLDYSHVFGEDEAQIQAADPWLRPGAGLRWREEVATFLSGPLRRYCPGAEQVDLATRLCTAGLSIPGSYAIEVEATVHGRAAPRRAPPPLRRFHVFRLKRYRPAAVAATLDQLGWTLVSAVPYGHEAGYPGTLALFLRREG